MQIIPLVHTVNQYLFVYINTIAYYLFVHKTNAINDIEFFFLIEI